MNAKRNSERETDQLDLFPPPPGRVGARQVGGAVSPGGGGYQDICGSPNFEGPEGKSDPRLDELRRIGLPQAWLLIAETVGFDAWLAVWRRLSSEEFNGWVRRDSGGTRMPMLRSYDSYLRYQRNRYIEALAGRGMKAPEIRRAVARNLREPLDEKHVLKIMRKR